MDRLDQYKHKTESVKTLRERRRKEEKDLRKERREKLLTSKRVRLDSRNEADIMTVEKVKEASAALENKSEDQHELLKFLKKAFGEGTKYIDAFLSVETALPNLVGLLSGTDADLQLQAVWCLTNLATGTEDQALTIAKEAGAYLATLLTGGNAPLEDQCAWAIGNIAGDGTKCQDMLNDQGVVVPLIKLLQSSNANVVQSSAFALSNMARGEPVHTQILVDNGVLPALINHLEYSEEKLKILAEIGWVLAYLSASGSHEQALLEAGILEKIDLILIEISEKHPNNFEVLTPLLRCLGNVCCGVQDVSARACENSALVPALGRLLTTAEHRHIKKECLWALSNITADESVCDQMKEAKMIKPIIELIPSAFDIKKEAAYCLCNIACHGTALLASTLADGALPEIIALLKNHDTDIVRLALNFCHLVLSNADEGLKMFEECDGLSGLEGLEYHADETIQSLAKQILGTYIYPQQDSKEEEEAKVEGKKKMVEDEEAEVVEAVTTTTE